MFHSQDHDKAVTKRNWILSSSSSTSDLSIGEGEFRFSVLPTFPQSRLRSSSCASLSIMDRINNVNDLNEKISETYRRRYQEMNSDSENASGSGSGRMPSFSRRATVVVDESFSFIDNELTKTVSESSSQGSYPRSKMDFTLMNAGDRIRQSIKSNSINDYAQAGDPNSVDQNASRPLFKEELILRCTNGNGEICAVYERRHKSGTSEICTNDQEKQDQNIQSDQAQRKQKRNLNHRYAVSFDDRVVVVDGNEIGSSSLDDHIFGIYAKESLVGRLQRFLKWLLRRRKESKITPTNCDLGFGSDTKDASTDISIINDRINDLKSMPNELEFEKSYFDMPTVNERLKFNPLFKGEDQKNGTVVVQTLEPDYCDISSISDRQRMKRDQETATSWTQILPIAEVHSKADRRLRKNNADRFLSRLDFDQLRTRKFGLALTLMILILALAGIGIGLTIYFE